VITPEKVNAEAATGCFTPAGANSAHFKLRIPH
jgi:hypothetical protein